MKKKNIIISIALILIIAIILGVIILTQNPPDSKPSKPDSTSTDNGEIKIYLELEDRIIYTHNLNSLKFTYQDETKELKDWFNENPSFLTIFLEQLELETAYDDGGTIIYKDGGTKLFNYEDLNIIVCSTLEGNKNIHIGKNLKYEESVCRLTMKKEPLKNKETFKNNLSTELGAYITSEILIPHEVSLKNILSTDLSKEVANKIKYSKVMQNDIDEFYAIIETEDGTVIDNIESILNTKYKDYKVAQVTDNYYAFVYSNIGDFNLHYFTLTGIVKKVLHNTLSVLIDNEEYIVYYNNNEDFKIDDKIKIIFNGNINESNPPQLGALYLEKIE